MRKLERALQSVRDVYVNVPKEYKILTEALRKADYEIQDLLHVFEFGKIDAVAMSKLNKQLKKVRIERRKLKNDLEILEEVMGFISIRNPKQHDYNKVIGNVRSIVKSQDRRTYTMRVRSDLQELIS